MGFDITGMDQRNPRAFFGPGLSQLQIDILAEIASGGSLHSAAERLNYTYDWINRTLRDARCRLGATSTAQACLIAHHRGWISSPTGSDLRSVPTIR